MQDAGGEAAARSRRATRLAQLGRFGEAAEEYAALVAVLLELGDGAAAGRAELACAGALSMDGRMEESLPHFARAADRFKQDGNGVGQVLAQEGRLDVLVELERWDPALEGCDRLLALTAQGEPPPLQEARLKACYHKARLLAARSGLEPSDDLRAALDCAVEVAGHEVDDPSPEDRAVEGQMRLVIGQVHHAEQRFPDAAAAYERAAEIGHLLRDQQMIELALTGLGMVLRQVPELGAARFLELAEQHHAAGHVYAEAVCRFQRAECLGRVRTEPWSSQAMAERRKLCAEEYERAGALFDRAGETGRAGDAYYQAAMDLDLASDDPDQYRSRCLQLLTTAIARFEAAGNWWGMGVAELAAANVTFGGTALKRVNAGIVRDPPLPEEAASLELLRRSVESFQRGGRPVEEAGARLMIATLLGQRGVWSDEWLEALDAGLSSYERARAALVAPHQREREDRRTASLLMLATGHLRDAAATRRSDPRWRAAVWNLCQAVKGRAFLDQQNQHDAWSRLVAGDTSLRELTGVVERARDRHERAVWNVNAALYVGDLPAARGYAAERDLAEEALREREREQLRRLDVMARDQPEAMRLAHTEPATVADLQAALNPGELYLEHLLGYGRLIRLAVTRDSFEIAMPDQVPSLGWVRSVSQYIRYGILKPPGAASGRDADAGGAAGAGVTDADLTFTRALVGTLPEGVETIIFCPHSHLVGLPWHLLPVEPGAAFGDRYTTAVVPAAGSFVQMRAAPAVAADASYLGVAYDAHDLDMGLLSSVDDEVETVACRYFADERTAEWQNYLATTEAAAFFDLRCGVKLLHLACHASRSGLGLVRNVTPVDLLDLGVRADILLLTGCDAGDFESDHTNEFLGVVRQLLIVTGARAAIVSIAKVPDEAATDFSDFVVAALTGRSPLGTTPPPAGPLAVGAAVEWARQRLRELLAQAAAATAQGERADPTGTDASWWSPWFVVGDPAVSLTGGMRPGDEPLGGPRGR